MHLIFTTLRVLFEFELGSAERLPAFFFLPELSEDSRTASAIVAHVFPGNTVTTWLIKKEGN